jgi:hypothetical protein
MSMLSGTVLGPSGDGPRKRHPVATGFIVLLMMGVLFAATFGAVRLLKGTDSPTPTASDTSTPGPCVTTTVRPGLVLPKPGTVKTNVFNATTRAGLARKTANDLKSRGFQLGTIANDPLGKALTNVGEIRYGAKGKDNALLMRFYIPGAVLVLDARTDATIDVVTGLKFVAVAPQKTVTAALAKPVPVASGDGCASPGASGASGATGATGASGASGATGAVSPTPAASPAAS